MTRDKEMAPSATNEPAAVWVPLDTLAPWNRNPRHNDHAVPEVAASIRRFGFTAPIVARKADGMIIAGHTRLKAALSLGMDRVPVRFVDLDEEEAQLAAIADNKVGEIAKWDMEALGEILQDLDVGEATEGLGFSEEELASIEEGDPTDEGEIKEWTAADLSPVEEIVIIIRSPHRQKADVVAALDGFDVQRAFLSYDGAVKW